MTNQPPQYPPQGYPQASQPQTPPHNFNVPPYPPQAPPYPPQGPPPVFQVPVKKKKGHKGLIALGVGVLVIVAIGIGNSKSPTAGTPQVADDVRTSAPATTNASATTAAAAPTTKAAPALPGIGTAVVSGDLSFTVTGYSCGVTVKDYKVLVPQGHFCKLDVTIKNNGKSQVTVSDSQIDLVDAAGVEYSTSSDTWMVEGTIFYKKINPGNSITGSAYFDVPKEVSPTIATFRAGLFSKAAQVKVF